MKVIFQNFPFFIIKHAPITGNIFFYRFISTHGPISAAIVDTALAKTLTGVLALLNWIVELVSIHSIVYKNTIPGWATS